jgi:hypothetical protein
VALNLCCTPLLVLFDIAILSKKFAGLPIDEVSNTADQRPNWMGAIIARSAGVGGNAGELDALKVPPKVWMFAFEHMSHSTTSN